MTVIKGPKTDAQRAHDQEVEHLQTMIDLADHFPFRGSPKRQAAIARSIELLKREVAKG